MTRPHVRVPAPILAEAGYVLRWVLVERFGLPVPAITAHESAAIEISLEGHEGVLRAPCLGGWAPNGAHPTLSFLPAEEGRAAVLYGDPQWQTVSAGIEMCFDPWGMIFWYLARVEEQEITERDAYGCLPARSTFPFRNGLLLRPVVDEMVEFLWGLMRRVWPGLARSIPEGRTIITCDVDVPYSRSVKSPRTLLEGIGADILRRRSPATALATTANFWRVHRRGDYSGDPCNTFDWFMDACDRQGLPAIFYFISGNDHPGLDDRYHLTHPFVREVMANIHQRGHEIGMHGSYVTHQEPAEVRKEAANLRDTCAALGIRQAAWGNRQHYLRWDWNVTPRALQDAGFAYDSTLGYNEHAGFRCGTSHPFPLWDWATKQALTLVERPLIAMEGAGLNADSMGLSHQDTARTFIALKQASLRHGGDFILLWHNNRLCTAEDRACLEEILGA